MLSPLDFALIKIHMLELEAERYEVRLSALRCKVAELLDNPIIVIVKENDGEL